LPVKQRDRAAKDLENLESEGSERSAAAATRLSHDPKYYECTPKHGTHIRHLVKCQLPGSLELRSAVAGTPLSLKTPSPTLLAVSIFTLKTYLFAFYA